MRKGSIALDTTFNLEYIHCALYLILSGPQLAILICTSFIFYLPSSPSLSTAAGQYAGGALQCIMDCSNLLGALYNVPNNAST